MADIRTFARLVEKAETITNSELPWEEKYHLFFGREGICDKVKSTGVRIEYCDPDTDYRDDVMAYLYALLAKNADISENPDCYDF